MKSAREHGTRMVNSLAFIRNAITRRPLRSIGICAGLAFVLGAWVDNVWPLVVSPTTHAQQTSLRLPGDAYTYINPLLLCNVNQQKNVNENIDLAQKVNDLIHSRISSGAADDISVYAIDYHSGQWVGVNENDRYDPASLLKVPLMIAYYQAAQRDPTILNQKVSYTGTDQNIDEHFRSPVDILPNKVYTIDQLIQSMIVNSDNTATALLQESIDSKALSEVYTDLGLPLPSDGPNPQYLSAKLYAYFFRVLYNATYLDREYSQKALELLDHSDFSAGIQAGLPTGTNAAQKFGERTIYDQSNALVGRELHDCGIVYKKDSPFLLCIMTRSNTASFDTLAKDIADVSALVYKNIN